MLDLELVPLAHRRLVDVARRGSARRRRRRGRRAPRSGGRPASSASATARRSGGGGARRHAARPRAPRPAARACRRSATLRIPPDWWRHGPHRVEPDDVAGPRSGKTGSAVSHCRSNSANGRVKRAGKVYGMSWFPGIDEQGPAEPAQERCRALVLLAPAAVRQVARDRRSARASTRSISGSRLRSTCGFLDAAHVQVGDVEEAHGQRRSRLYTEFHARRIDRDLRRPLPRVASGRRDAQAAPRRAADAPRSRRRSAAGQRLSSWRKAVAIGAFAVGTFGLGFTLGGLIFGRWRKA